MFQQLEKHISPQISIAPLIVFRVVFGIIILVSIIRFWLLGWIYDLYIAPQYFFTYYGFGWVKPLGELGMYSLFSIMIISALGITLGAFYRLSALLFFLAFTYVELIDKSTYLNHYYFVSLVAFILIWLPANRRFSLDVIWNPSLRSLSTPAWTINIIKFQLAIVYFYAGLAKINSDWLLEAMPLRMWLPVNTHLPLIGPLMDEVWMAYAFSWFGAVYDLSIPFLLWKSKTRPFAFATVVVFHIATWLLFPIGMFPFIMIFSTLIFFSSRLHETIINFGTSVTNIRECNNHPITKSISIKPVIKYGFMVYLVIQILFPWRYLLYPGNLFWTEEGFRFSWRVMLIEKAGYVTFHVTDPRNGSKSEIAPIEYLTPLQEKQMSTQPDMILQFAHFLKSEFQAKGIQDPEIRAEAYVTLNGKSSRPFIDRSLDLTQERDSFLPKRWILKYNDEI